MSLFDSERENLADGDTHMDGDSQADSVSSVKKVRAVVKKMFEGALGSHDWTHTLRVCRLCERIGSEEKVDMEVLRIAAYLHDIGRSYQDASEGSVCHAEKGAQMAQDVLKELPLSGEQKENIIHCIKTHRFRGTHTPKTAEAKVLFDADKLDSIGAVGVGRAFLFAGEVGARLHNPDMTIEETKSYSKDDTGFREYKLKLCKIRDSVLTRRGRKLANERHAFMENFFKQFIEEYEGKR